MDDAYRHLARALSPQAARLRRVAVTATVAEALWLPQAAAISVAIGGLAEGSADLARVALCAALVAVLGLVRALLALAAAGAADTVADRVVAAIRAEQLVRADRRTALADAAPSGAIAALLTDKLGVLLPYLSRWPAARLRVMVTPALILLAALWISWAAALILAVAGPLVPVFMALIGAAARSASEDRMDEIADLNALLVERLVALPDIRLAGAGPRVLAGLARSADRLRRRTMRVLAVAFLSSAVLELFSALGVAMMAVYVGFSLLGPIGFGVWGAPLTLGQGMFVLLLAPAFFQPMRDLAAAWHDRVEALSLARDLAREDRRAAPAILGRGGGRDGRRYGSQCGEQCGEGVGLCGDLRTHGLRVGDHAIPDLVVAPGESLALTGASGSGKSSVLAMLAGLVPAAPGRILVGGTRLDAMTADEWRAGLALIPQQPHFRAEPLRIMLGAGAGDGAVRRALRLARAEGVIDRLPGGLDTVLGERGAGVSGGEARRLLIAQAILRGARVILADEPTADLDAETAAAVTGALLGAHRNGATLILATHDPVLAARMSRQVALG